MNEVSENNQSYRKNTTNQSWKLSNDFFYLNQTRKIVEERKLSNLERLRNALT